MCGMRRKTDDVVLNKSHQVDIATNSHINCNSSHINNVNNYINPSNNSSNVNQDRLFNNNLASHNNKDNLIIYHQNI
jgi:hypothetical protein